MLVYNLKEVANELKIPYHDLAVLVRWILYKGKKNGMSYRLGRNQITKLKRIL